MTQDTGGCGTDSVRVYFAWIYEDNDREASEDAYMADHIRAEF